MIVSVGDGDSVAVLPTAEGWAVMTADDVGESSAAVIVCSALSEVTTASFIGPEVLTVYDRQAWTVTATGRFLTAIVGDTHVMAHGAIRFVGQQSDGEVPDAPV